MVQLQSVVLQIVGRLHGEGDRLTQHVLVIAVDAEHHLVAAIDILVLQLDEVEGRLGIELAGIDVQRQIAAEQAKVVGEALRSANIDIVGGETQFFDRITNAITTGKVVDRTIGNSRVLDDVKETFFNGDPDYFKGQLATWLADFGVSSEDLKNLSVSALLGKLIGEADGETRSRMVGLLGAAERFGLGDAKPAELIKKLG